ncbi:insulin-like receptor [Leptotrombidium deliense]|uniref:receptor protein-tyrosine kinase n=1 Tax=Leptotrombidium deliense TaxID=299467 RepID=A0A443SM17_9ACAR|nr:insulin-like receptor [Leptotrombidium deliense]
MDIRNYVEQLNKLENCTAIEGYLRIVLIGRPKAPANFENYSFPLLTEITDYFVMFRVHGIHSVSQLFPNLAVIRGRQLEHNYAFIMLWNSHLQEIGLINLIAIVRGNVYIEENSKLCYADTIDWNVIAPSSSHHIRLCNSDLLFTVCPKECPNNCNTKNPKQCCHSNCIGGCDGPGPLDCVACKKLIVNRTCVDKCPHGYYEVTENAESSKLSPLIIGKIQDMKGCTEINGSLYISIEETKGVNVINELEQAFKHLETIQGFLKISRSRPLTSLSFLKNLRLIKGRTKERNK